MKRKRRPIQPKPGAHHRKKTVRKVLESRVKTFGQPPGTLIHIGEQRGESPVMTVMGYNDGQAVTQTVADVHECLLLKERFRTVWINVDGVHDASLIERIGAAFGISPLILEDILHTGQRPKVEDFEKYLYLVLQMIDFNSETGEIGREQLSLVLGDNFVITFQENPGDMFDPVRQRIRTPGTRLRKYAADFLAYSLLDAVVDNYFSILEEIENTIDRLDADLMADYSKTTFESLYALKRELIILRKSVWPLREIIGSVTRNDFRVVGDEVGPYFRDVYDHVVLVIDTVEVFRDIVTGMHETYLAGINNRMNEIMKFLTMIATIFMPMSFVAGVYGMNFKNMPELRWTWGYFAALGLMGSIFIGMLLYYRSRKWY
jgi:magnesium transporter